MMDTCPPPPPLISAVCTVPYCTDRRQIRKRMTVYSTMLEHMSPEHKITVTAKLAQEVLSAAIDGGLPLASSSAAAASSSSKSSVDSPAFARGNKSGGGVEARKKASAVVRDALTVMASPGMRVGGRGGAAAAADADDGSGQSFFRSSVGILLRGITAAVASSSHFYLDTSLVRCVLYTNATPMTRLFLSRWFCFFGPEDMGSQQSGPGGMAAAKRVLLSKARSTQCRRFLSKRPAFLRVRGPTSSTALERR